MSTENYFDQFFSLLRKELHTYTEPVVSRRRNSYPQTPFTVLIACLLSLRTKDEVTDRAAEKLLRRYDTPEKILRLSDQYLESLIYPVGFYKTKAKRIKEISRNIIENYAGRVPDDFDELLKLKGVGRKTANIVMVYGHKKHGYLPIDTHCHRIPNRLGWIQTKTPEETEYALKKILPEKYWDAFNHFFVIFGQRICVPIAPWCSKCPVSQYCKKNGVKNRR
ncbi:MAG: endonuclease III [Candidatus Thermoplasmatota archaeon]